MGRRIGRSNLEGESEMMGGEREKAVPLLAARVKYCTDVRCLDL
jgi:hypothetical protein